MTNANMVKFISQQKLINEIIENSPDGIIIENSFVKSYAAHKVYVIQKGKNTTIHIGDDMNGYREANAFIENNSIGRYCFFNDGDVD